MADILTRACYVGAGEADRYGLLRPSSLLSFLQDAATAHSEELSFSREDLLHSSHAVWILVKIAYFLEAPLRYQKELEVRTWHRGPKGASFYRDFEIWQDGLRAGRAVSAWVVADPETMSVIRPSRLPMPAASGEIAGRYSDILGKIPAPDVCRPAFTKTIRYSDLDINNHLNNTRYADLICDALDLHLHPCYIRRMQINYLSQCMAGEEIGLFFGNSGQDSQYVAGRAREGNRKFDALLCCEKL